MNAEEARSRLGLSNDISPQAVLRAHRAAASAAARLPEHARADVLDSLDSARDALLGVPPPAGASVLELLSTPRGMAALTAAGVALSALSLMTDVATGVVAALAPLLFGLGLAMSVRRRKVIAGVFFLALIVSAVLAVRAATDPGTQEFFYSADFLSEQQSTSPFAHQVGIPLTSDPSTGTVDESVVTETTSFVVSCVKSGPFRNRRPKVSWAYVAAGDYETLWIPVGYLAALRPGAARTLMGCSDWRWLLQNLGSP